MKFKSPDGLEISNQLFLPRDLKPGEKRPAIVFVHGGPSRQMLPAYHYMQFYHWSYAFNQWLQTQGMTRTEMERTIARQIIGTRVFAAVTQGVAVSTARLREYYESHLSDYTAPDGSTTLFRDVRGSILAQVQEDEEAAAYTTWLEQERQAATVAVLLEDWWRDLP